MLGRTFGKYRIVDRLGRGGMGTVYRAIDETLEREVALKVLNPDLADSDIVRRFRAEATTLAKLAHPGIATVFELYRDEQELFLVMEFVRGEPLDKVAERWGPLPPERAAQIVMQILEPLGYAHRAGIVHRDLKPANLMVTEFGTIKIMDFGIARVAGSEHMTSDGMMMGTPAYMAPEQVLGAEVDGRADLYSVGVILYRLLTGNLPFKADTAIAMVQKQIKDPPTPVKQFRTELPAWCERVLARALAKSPADRFQTADEFRAALASVVMPAPNVAIAAAPGAEAAAVELTLAPNASLSIEPPLGETMPPTAAAPPAPSQALPSPPAAVAPAAQATSPPKPAARDATVVIRRKVLLSWAVVIAAVAVAAILYTSISDSNRASVPKPAADRRPEPIAAPAKPVTERPGPETGRASIAPPPSPSPEAPARATPEKRPTPAPRAASRGPSRPAAPPVPPVTFSDLRSLVSAGDRVREQDASLTLTNTQFESAVKGSPGESIPYRAVLSATYSRSRDPLWRSPAGPAVVLKTGGGGFPLFRGDRHWLTIRTAQKFFVFRLKAEQVQPISEAFAARSGKTVERVTGR